MNDGNLHQVVEVFCHNQGLTEGTLETAEYLVQKVMEMKSPSWLHDKDYCKSMKFCINPGISANKKEED